MAYTLKYSNKLATMAAQWSNADAVGIGSKLALVVCGMRNGDLKAPAAGKVNWTGAKSFLERPELQANNVAAQDVSRAIAVVAHHLIGGEHDVLLCDDADVTSIILSFTAEHGSLGTAYNALKAEGKPTNPAGTSSRVWTLEQAVASLVKSARANGVDPVTVQVAVENAIRATYGA